MQRSESRTPQPPPALRVDRRRPTRLPVELPLVVEHATGRFQAVALNLGLGGVFIATSHEAAYGTKIMVLIELPGAPKPTALPGLIRWQNADGFGVQFLELGAHTTYALSVFLTGLKK